MNFIVKFISFLDKYLEWNLVHLSNDGLLSIIHSIGVGFLFQIKLTFVLQLTSQA